MTNPQPKKRESMVERFQRAAQIGSDNWRDPQHDLDAIRLATAEERIMIERFLISRGIQHFIDAEALVLLDTPGAREALCDAFRTGATEIQAAIAYLAPQLFTEDVRAAELIRRIEQCDVYQGLSLTLTQIEDTHPPAVIHAMLRRIARDPGITAVHYAGLLLFLHNRASEPFDWGQRPFLLRFNPGNESDRHEAFVELCSMLGYEANHYTDNR